MNKRHLILGLLVVAAVFVAGYAAHTPEASRNEGENFPLLAKRLFIEKPNDTRINFSPLRTDLNKYFTDRKLEGSVYFEYLPTGTSVRVNPDVRYRAASLIKLPVAMELYKANELGKIDIHKKVKLKQEWLNAGYGTLYEKGVGYEISLKDAADIMLKESDNTALRVIIDANKDLDLDNRALASLDIELSTAEDGGIDIGTRAYSSFLKCLYFACYNSVGDSQTILQTLTQTPFNDRIAAGVADKSIPIAHKIGVFNSQVQSDCGIVYMPARNYVLCVMLRGDDTPDTKSRMAEISKIVYDFVKN
ncbi:MAG TPA: serine hydrolase [Candidatus Saccharimonadales bacterium]|nr:serine hydrolase [Candidatus Saccharimonadales bacterium]